MPDPYLNPTLLTNLYMVSGDCFMCLCDLLFFLLFILLLLFIFIYGAQGGVLF